jgi:hypothetical protein
VEAAYHQDSRADRRIRQVAVLDPGVPVGALHGIATAAVEDQGRPLGSHMKGHCIQSPNRQSPMGRGHHLGRTSHQAHNHQGPQEMAQNYCTASEAGVSGLPAKDTPWLWLVKG